MPPIGKIEMGGKMGGKQYLLGEHFSLCHPCHPCHPSKKHVSRIHFYLLFIFFEVRKC